MDEYTKTHLNKIKEFDGNCYSARVTCNEICPFWDECNAVFYNSKADILEKIKIFENSETGKED